MRMQIYCRVLEFAFLVLEPAYGRFDLKPGAHRELLKILVDISCSLTKLCNAEFCSVKSWDLYRSQSVPLYWQYRQRYQ